VSETCYRALVVDDNAAHRQLFFAILSSLGLDVDLAADGLEAVAAARSADYEFILMDVSMPNLDGFLATQLIREHEVKRGHRSHIIMVTSHGAPSDFQRSQHVGADGHVTKPVDIAGLMAAIEGRYLSAA